MKIAHFIIAWLFLALFLNSARTFAALDFNGTSDELSGAAILTAAPLSICAWVNSDSATARQVIVSLGLSSGDHRFTLGLQGDVSDNVEFTTRDTASSVALTSTTYSAGTWHHVCGVTAAANSRAAYLDGGGKGTSAGSATPVGIDSASIGRRPVTAQFFNGRIAEVGIWNRALSDAEVLSLSKGFSPACLRTGLVNYTKLVRTVQDEARAFAWTTTGTTVADHPRIFNCF